jgi:hypothetical protein
MGSPLLLGRLCAAGRMEIEVKPTGHSLPLTKTPGALKIIIGSTSFGAAVGLGVGALLGDNAAAGAFSGTLLGLLTGSVAAAISQGSHQVEIDVDVHGRILFRFNPVKARD